MRNISWKALFFILTSCRCHGMLTPVTHRNDSVSSSTNSGQNDNAPLRADNYPYHVKLDDNYDLNWDFNSTHIIFHTHVKTNGYIGFGISNHGAMFPSDIIIAWVKDGRVHFADRHATGHSTPAIDAQQDWHLISGTEQGKYTTIIMIRQLNTCDDEDFPIGAGTTRIIYSYSPMDPSVNSSIHYHGNTRGTKSVLLLDPPTKETNETSLPDDVITIDFLNINYSVPAIDTTYSCTIKKLPPLKDKHHVIRFEPLVQKGHERLVHHIVLYFCANPVDDNMVDKNYKCYNGAPSAIRYQCQHMFLSWAIGGTGFDFPAHVGHPVGGPNDPIYFKMEMHYDNMHKRNGSSGFRLYLTKHLRQYDSSTLQAGVKVTPFQILPPYNDNILSKGYCHQDCLAQVLGDDEIHVFADFLHTHLVGKSVKTRHIRNGTELPPLLEDMHYDFDYQEIRPLKEERVIKKGDSLITECYYDTSKKTTITYGGLKTSQEMCLSILLYYPRKPINLCVSRTKYSPRKTSRWGVFHYVKNLDWTKKDVHTAFAKLTDESRIVTTCTGPGNSKLRYNKRPTPNVTVPYEPVDQCKTGL